MNEFEFVIVCLNGTQLNTTINNKEKLNKQTNKQTK